MSIGLPELFLIIMFSGIGLLPIAVAVWAIVALHRVRVSQQAMQAKLDNIERLLQRA
jgi:hypothetical protein